MAKLKLKKGETGLSAGMMARKKAMQKIGVTLRQFRRLCILKGVFPRPAPSGNAKLRNKTMFLRKDITFLAQDPIVDTLRQKLAFRKKKKRLITRREPEALRRLERGRPIMRLDHIIRERYPTFQDAVRGLDDALTLLGVVAAHTGGQQIATEKCRRAAQLLREFEHYVAEAHLLTKCFIARKGLYYQARIEGINVTWMIPHPFSLASANVEYDVIRSFLELYVVLVQFVVYKLYQDRHMTYPPKLNAAKNADGEYLTAFIPDEGTKLVNVVPLPAPTTTKAATAATKKVEATKAGAAAQNDEVMKKRIASLSKKLDKITKDDAREEAAEEAAAEQEAAEDDEVDEDDNEDNEDDDDEIVDAPADEEDAKEDEEEGEKEKKGAEEEKKKTEEKKKEEEEGKKGGPKRRHELLFSRCHFFVSREVPRRILELIILSNGGELSWEGKYAPYPESDPRVTHVIMDRDVIPAASLAAARSGTRDFVQPQWVFDCANEQMLIPTDKYAPGRQAPPHLSPFVRDSREGYVPERREELRALHSFLDSKSTDAELADSEDVISNAMLLKQAEEEKRAVEREVEAERTRQRRKEERRRADKDDEAADTELIDDFLDEEGERERYEAELEAELQGKSYAAAARDVARKVKKTVAQRQQDAALDKKHEVQDERSRLVGMLSSRKYRAHKHNELQRELKERRVRRLHKHRDREVDEKGVQSDFQKEHARVIPPPLKRPKKVQD